MEMASMAGVWIWKTRYTELPLQTSQETAGYIKEAGADAARSEKKAFYILSTVFVGLVIFL